MKKLNLRGISEILSEKELKSVVGGSGSSGGIYVAFQCCLKDGTDCLPPEIGLCGGSDCETCMRWTVGQYGYNCVNITCWSS